MTSGSNNVIIHKATADDLDAIKTLVDAHRRELGFVRRPALAEAIDRQEVLIARHHQVSVGFVAYRHRQDEQTTLYHIAVEPGYRRQGIGRALMEALQVEARSRGKRRIRLKCPKDLTANCFYEQLSCQLVSKETGKNRVLLIWELSLF